MSRDHIATAVKPRLVVERLAPAGQSPTWEEFAEQHSLTMRVTERDDDLVKLRWIGESARFYARFDRVDVQEHPGFLAGMIGNGSSPEEAIDDYLREIAGRKLVFGAHTGDRREFRAPKMWRQE